MSRSRFVIRAIESFLNPQQSNEWIEKHEQEIVHLEKEHETRVAQIKHDHANEIARVKRDQETQIISLTQQYEDEIAQVRREAERKDNSISELQSNNDMELALLRANLEDLRNQLGFMQHEYAQLRLLLSAPKQSFWGRVRRKQG
ncbi:MAG: hypothetical protein WCE81_03575 [Halobacteriota archaeon]